MGRSLRIQILFVIFLSIPWHLANAYSYSISGATASSQETDANGKITGKLLVSAGYALPGNCDSQDGSTTCNSCTGKTVDFSGTAVAAPCNEHSIYDSLPLTVQIESDKTDINGLTVGVAKSSTYSGNNLSTFTGSTVSGRSYSVSATWTVIMAALSGSLSCSTTCGGKLTFYFGPIKDDKFVEYNTVEITYGVINTTNSTTNAVAPACKPTTTEPLTSTIASEGLCYFNMFPGDEKAYITDFINGWGDTPTDPTSTLNYSSLAMFYAEKGSQTSLATLKGIKNNSSKGLISIQSTAGDPLTEYKISGLENSEDGSKSYCFLPAIQDQVGNIYYFLDVAKTNSTSQIDDASYDLMCASPSEVVGVLSDKDCFIATVAFGSRNHPFLDVLRSFRNKFLHPYSLGKKFIKFYYKNGPGYAKEISEYPLVKSVVKVVLLPIIAIAFLLLNPIWLVGVGAVGSAAYVYRRRKQRQVK